MNKGPFSLSRQELYELVWSTPMTRLAKEFGLSDQGLAKKCRKHKIPRPPVGFWAKVEHGKRVSRARLPAIDDPTLDTIEFSPPTQSSHAEPPKPSDPRLSLLATVDPASAKRRRLPLIQDSRRAFEDAHANDYGLLHPRKEKTEALQIKVTKSSLKRAHDIFSVLQTFLEVVGGGLGIDRDGRTCIHLDGEEIRVSLQEQTKRVRDPKELAKPYWQRRRFDPTGVLTLSVSAFGLWNRRCNWRDGKRATLEEQLPAIVADLLSAAEAVREARLQSEREARERARRRSEKSIYKERWEQLSRLIEDQQRFQALVAVLDRIDEDSDENIRAWLTWAKEEVQRIDSLVRLRSYTELSQWTEKEARQTGADLWPKAMIE